MRRVSTHEIAEDLELDPCFVGDRDRRLDDGVPLTVAINPLAEVEVKPYAELRMRGCVQGRFWSGVTADHEARARHDALLVADRDTAVDTGAQAEVVGVHNQPP